MSARGVDFLEDWIENNVPAMPGNWIEARKLADILRVAAAGADLTMAELKLEDGDVEKIIHEAMVHQNEPGTPGD